jgi:hypothetical protein
MKNLPIYIGFFEFVFNTRKRGKALISELSPPFQHQINEKSACYAYLPDSTYERSLIIFYFKPQPCPVTVTNADRVPINIDQPKWA